MRLLVVESNSEGQALLARRLESMERVDKDTLDLTVSLASEMTFLARAAEYEVIMLGPGLSEPGTWARKIKQAAPSSEVLVVVSDEAYARGAFRSVLSHGARRVFPDSAPAIDLTQELMSIYEEFRSSGRIRAGRVVAVVHAKGGIGGTSLCAALAEACSVHGQRTMLWDMDIETRDLCRSLATEGNQAAIVRQWVEGACEISRDSLRKALMPVSSLVSILPPPDQMGAAVDLMARVETIELIQSILNLARVTHENVIIDTAGRVGPAVGAVLRSADVALVMVDDSVLGLSGARFFLSSLRSVVKNTDNVRFLCSGISVPKSQVIQHVEREWHCGPQAWTLPMLPFDAAAGRWPGSGGTLFSLGKRSTRRIVEEIAAELQLIQDLPEPVLLLPFLKGRPEETKSRPRGEVEALSPFKSLWQRVANSF